MGEDPVIEWLLEPDQPAVRYRTLTELLHRPERDPEVREAKREILRTGWAAEILAERTEGGWWGDERSFYTPKYLATNWRMLVLSDLGLDRSVPAVRTSCEVWMARAPLKGGGVGGNSKGEGHLCFTGNMARALIRFGYADDPRVRRALDWLVHTASPKGGWSCWTFGEYPAQGRNLDSWEALSALAAYPRERWTPEMAEAVRRGAEFFLERELFRQGARYEPWFRFHYPVHYYYDLLVGLDLLNSLGYGNDRRLAPALAHLVKKRRRDGRWNLDAQHPDVAGSLAAWFAKHPGRATPLVLEPAGQPSKMVTLRARLVLDRIAAGPRADPGARPKPRGPRRHAPGRARSASAR